jgi:hypothetical protein
MAESQYDCVISEKRLEYIARLHKIPLQDRGSLRSAIERAYNNALIAQAVYCMRKNTSTLQGEGKKFKQFVGALEKAQKLLLGNEDVRRRLKYAGKPNYQQGSNGLYQANLARPKPRDTSIDESFCAGDDLAQNFLEELLTLARAGLGDARLEKDSPVEAGSVAAAAELAMFWFHVLRRQVQFNDWERKPEDQRLHYLAFVDDVFHSLYPDMETRHFAGDFGRYIRDRKAAVLTYIKNVGVSPPGPKRSAKNR